MNYVKKRARQNLHKRKPREVPCFKGMFNVPVPDSCEP